MIWYEEIILVLQLYSSIVIESDWSHKKVSYKMINIQE